MDQHFLLCVRVQVHESSNHLTTRRCNFNAKNDGVALFCVDWSEKSRRQLKPRRARPKTLQFPCRCVSSRARGPGPRDSVIADASRGWETEGREGREGQEGWPDGRVIEESGQVVSNDTGHIPDLNLWLPVW